MCASSRRRRVSGVSRQAYGPPPDPQGLAQTKFYRSGDDPGMVDTVPARGAGAESGQRAGSLVLDGDRHGAAVDGVAALRTLLQQQPGFDPRSVPMTQTPRDGVHTLFQARDARAHQPPGRSLRHRYPRPRRLCARAWRRPAAGRQLSPDRRAARPGRRRSSRHHPARLPAGIVALIGSALGPAAGWGAAGLRRRPPASAPTPRPRCTVSPPSSPPPARAARNQELNKAAFVLGTMVARDWIRPASRN